MVLLGMLSPRLYNLPDEFSIQGPKVNKARTREEGWWAEVKVHCTVVETATHYS